MKKLNFLLIALLSLASLNARTLYLQPNENWKKDGARFAVYGFVDENDNNWFSMTAVSDNIYSADVDDKYTNIIFVRMNGETTENNWDNKWNQTADLTAPEGQNMYTIADGAWDKGEGTWSVYDNQGGNNGDNGNNGNNGDNGNNGGDEDNGSLEGWFYKGYIDGKNVEPSTATKFVKGTADFACTQKSYIFVLYQDANGGVQYMTRGYHEGLTHQTVCKGLENETGENKGDSMPLEAGMHTLYLYDNEDGTYELSIEQLEGKKLVGAETNALEEVTYTLDRQAPMYNIMGMQVSPSYKGVVLQNGSKFVIF